MRRRPYFRRMVIAGPVGLGLAVFSATGASADDTMREDGYALLSLKGQHVKWGKGRIGQSATVRYAFVKSTISRKGARNCRNMAAFPAHFGSDNVPFLEVSAEIRAAFSDWAAAAALHFVKEDDPEAADLLLGIQAEPSGIAYADVAEDTSRVAGPAPIRHAAICFNPELPWETAFDGDSETHDIRYVASHEIGHILGLDHTLSRDSTIMGFKYREIHRAPQPGDIAGVRYLYGPAPVLAAIATVGGAEIQAECGEREPGGLVKHKTAGHDVPPFPAQTGVDPVSADCVYVSAGSMSLNRISEEP